MSGTASAPATKLALAPERLWLDDTSWVDIARGFLPDAAAVYRELLGSVPWVQGSTYRFDHRVAENHLGASVPPTFHPALLATYKALRAHYGHELMSPTLVLYQHGRHAMGVHRDSDLRWCTDTLIGILTLGATRPFVLKPVRSPRDAPPSHDVAPAGGDLLVMGGRAQVDWLHGVPPVRAPVGPRISVQWRWTSRTGPPERGGSSRAARRYGFGR